jgi:hypothetical protein
MKSAIVIVLLLSFAAAGQQRSLPPQKISPSVAGTVTLSLAEYDRLVELAARKPKPAETAPVSFSLSRAVFSLRVDADAVVGSLEVAGQILSRGPAKVPLTTGLTIVGTHQGQNPLPLVRDGATHSIVIAGPGPFDSSLDVATPLVVDAGRASASFPVPVCASALLNLDVPGSHADIHVEPGIVTSRVTSADRSRIEATLEPGKPVRLWWTARETTASAIPREASFLSDVKTMITLGPDVRVTALCDVSFIRGEATELTVPLPSGFEVVEATGSTLESSEIRAGALILKLRQEPRKTHQFLIAVEGPSRLNKLDAPLLSISGSQRETGEVLIEGAGAMEVTATEGGGLRRVDVRETNAIARSLGRLPLQAAFRYHRQAVEAPKLQLAWILFPEGDVLPAIAERATITTLLNVQGKSLTEVTMRVRNHGQAFVKIDLPSGANLLSAEVEGEKVKPVSGSDGSRVPLLRPGFRPSGPYTVSFVYLSAGSAFLKNGSYELTAPRLDIPVTLMSWEVFLPDKFRVRQFGGNALYAGLLNSAAQDVIASERDDAFETDAGVAVQQSVDISELGPGQIGGIVVDPAGAVVSGAVVTVTNTQTGGTQKAISDGDGHFVVSGVNPGATKVKIESPGFRSFEQALDVAADHPARMGVTLQLGAATETVTVVASGQSGGRDSRRLDDMARKINEQRLNMPSQNVTTLQRKVAGILPVRVEVPRAGKSYRFVRPLVLDEETKVSFRYDSR